MCHIVSVMALSVTSLICSTVHTNSLSFFLFCFSPLPICADGNSSEIEEVAKEWEHALWQNTMDKELNELNKRLEQKEVSFIVFILVTLSCRHEAGVLVTPTNI